MSAGATVDLAPTPVLAEGGRSLRASAFALAVVLVVGFLVPPLGTLARRYEYVEALQFIVFIVWAPALFVMSAPWAWLGLSRRREDAPGVGLVDRWAAVRARHRDPVRIGALYLVYATLVCVWRAPFAVDGVARHWWVAIFEALLLFPVGTAVWTELIESPPLAPRLTRPYRIGLAAFSMWIIWILAYFVALSHGSWFNAFVHRPGVGVSLAADQQLSAGVMWVLTGSAFIPLIFVQLVRWLQSEEDPTDELRQVVWSDRIRRGSGESNT